MKKLIIALALLFPVHAYAQGGPLINWSPTTSAVASSTPLQVVGSDPQRVCFVLQNTSTTPVIVAAGATCVASPPNGWVLNQFDTTIYCNFAMTNNPPRMLAMNTQAISICTATSSANVVWQIAH